MSITRLLVLDCSRDRYTSPVDTNAANMVILGCIGLLGSEFVVLCCLHFILRNSLVPSQVWSMFMIYLPPYISEINCIANCYRKTRFFSELAFCEIDWIFLYFISRSSFKILARALGLTSMSSFDFNYYCSLGMEEIIWFY